MEQNPRPEISHANSHAHIFMVCLPCVPLTVYARHTGLVATHLGWGQSSDMKICDLRWLVHSSLTSIKIITYGWLYHLSLQSTSKRNTAILVMSYRVLCAPLCSSIYQWTPLLVCAFGSVPLLVHPSNSTLASVFHFIFSFFPLVVPIWNIPFEILYMYYEHIYSILCTCIIYIYMYLCI